MAMNETIENSQAGREESYVRCGTVTFVTSMADVTQGWDQ